MTTKLFILAGFLIAFAAGWATANRSASLMPALAKIAPTSNPRGDREGWLVNQLALTDTQQQQLRQIWDNAAHGPMRHRDDARRELRQQRDDAIAKLIRPEDKSAYDAEMKNYADKTAAMESQSKADFESAVQKTREILNDDQRAKYETLLQQMYHHDRRSPETSPSSATNPGERHTKE